jgi:ribosomal protein L35AE/L33A
MEQGIIFRDQRISKRISGNFRSGAGKYIFREQRLSPAAFHVRVLRGAAVRNGAHSGRVRDRFRLDLPPTRARQVDHGPEIPHAGR